LIFARFLTPDVLPFARLLLSSLLSRFFRVTLGMTLTDGSDLCVMLMHSRLYGFLTLTLTHSSGLPVMLVRSMLSGSFRMTLTLTSGGGNLAVFRVEVEVLLFERAVLCGDLLVEDFVQVFLGRQAVRVHLLPHLNHKLVLAILLLPELKK
jgi:hypothetical protein